VSPKQYACGQSAKVINKNIPVNRKVMTLQKCIVVCWRGKGYISREIHGKSIHGLGTVNSSAYNNRTAQ
jgi:hypothetical protein